jgi:hypothetical protein
MSRGFRALSVVFKAGLIFSQLALLASHPQAQTRLGRWTRTFRANGSWLVQPFTLSGVRRLRLRSTTTGPADAAIFSQDQLSSFSTNRSFQGWGVSERGGTRQFLLGAGLYYLGVRNQSGGTSEVTVELDLMDPAYRVEVPMLKRSFLLSWADLFIRGRRPDPTTTILGQAPR